MPPRRSGRTTRHIADGTKQKRCPNGITSTIIGIYKDWLHTVGKSQSDRMSVTEFLKQSNFSATCELVANTYLGIPERDRKANLRKLMYSMAAGNQQMPFYRLRSFAQFVGLPTGLFLLFTQCVSDEVRCNEKNIARESELIKLIHGIRRVADAAERYIQEAKDRDGLFIRTYEEKERDANELGGERVPIHYIADVEVLNQWVQAFNDERANRRAEL